MSGKGFGKRIYLLEEGNFPLLRPQVDGMALKSESSLGVFSKKKKRGVDDYCLVCQEDHKMKAAVLSTTDIAMFLTPRYLGEGSGFGIY